ncbi:HK97 gp10 family phage protein [Vreelandella andesensis]|uniref:HK97 gp10 family phage protein n=1 Tax=Vreelandella andesensis TaxID=447567 RepID=A0A433KF00_9GAMM|nr:HK97 gp10 family phage protein [Halomonas andesensis]RUR26842.1 HK97 gp10 family phage protein [Halomonas andesensis]
MGWSRLLGGFVSEVEKTQNKRLRAAAMQAFSGVIERSPVDTGAFRSNNTVSVGTPDYSADESKTDDPLAEGMQIIGRVNNAFGVIYVQNNLIYAEELENGSSGQTGNRPGGIYAVTFNDLKEASR